MSIASIKKSPRPVKVHVRLAIKADIPAVQKIYAHYVRSTTASFEEEPPTVAEMTTRWQRILDHKLPYLVAIKGKRVVGYAFACPFRERSGYRYTIEDSVYVNPDYLGRNVGNTLLSELIKYCTDVGFRQMIAVIGDSTNAASLALHSRHGFFVVGALGSTCFKFGRWVDAVLMQRTLGDGDTSSSPELPNSYEKAR
ncbi:MAG: GNAT family N-acetyltransferase [Candidatus Marinimicrobia bacterium]|nr:GNAT family N-acetyltransferase [Candidatus Neomarinimicrobiota bacterium]